MKLTNKFSAIIDDNGFNAIASGWRSEDGVYSQANILGGFWTSSTWHKKYGWWLCVHFISDGSVELQADEKQMGLSVRCIKK